MTTTFPPRRTGATSALALVALALFAAAPLAAQDPDDHLGGWYALEGSWKPVQGRFGFEADLQFRDFQMAGDFAQFSLRSGLVLHARSRPLSLVVGAAWFLAGEPGASDATRAERRVYQTVNFSQTISRSLRLDHRARAEQRWFQGDYFRSRYRYRLEADVALGGQGFTGQEVRLVVSDEVLVNGETEAGGRRFDRLDQNRAYVGVNWPVGTATRVETGYLNVLTGGRTLHRIRMTVRLAL